MNITATFRTGSLRGLRARRGPAVEAFIRAWRSITARHWLVAIGLGVAGGVLYGGFYMLYFRMLDDVRVFATLMTRWVVLMTGLACALAYAIALLRDLGGRGAIRPRHVVLTILVVTAFGSLVADPIAVGVNFTVHTWLFGSATGHFAQGADLLGLLARTFPQTGEKIATLVTTVMLSAVYYLKDARTSDALATAQLGLSRAQKRRLTEELRNAQAALEPDFLFATLAEIDRRFRSDPAAARRLLDALIRYLRAALPAKDDEIGTLGQQATLARAYLEIGSIRSAGRLQGVIDVPGELERRLYAPALILPLVALVCGDAAACGRDTEILVKASASVGKLTVEVRGPGCEPRATTATEATLAPLRDRLRALYGDTAELTYVTRMPRGVSARIVIEDPGNA